MLVLCGASHSSCRKHFPNGPQGPSVLICGFGLFLFKIAGVLILHWFTAAGCLLRCIPFVIHFGGTHLLKHMKGQNIHSSMYETYLYSPLTSELREDACRQNYNCVTESSVPQEATERR